MLGTVPLNHNPSHLFLPTPFSSGDHASARHRMALARRGKAPRPSRWVLAISVWMFQVSLPFARAKAHQSSLSPPPTNPLHHTRYRGAGLGGAPSQEEGEDKKEEAAKPGNATPWSAVSLSSGGQGVGWEAVGPSQQQSGGRQHSIMPPPPAVPAATPILDSEGEEEECEGKKRRRVRLGRPALTPFSGEEARRGGRRANADEVSDDGDGDQQRLWTIDSHVVTYIRMNKGGPAGARDEAAVPGRRGGARRALRGGGCVIGFRPLASIHCLL